MSLTHVDAAGRPRMVDVGAKPASARMARAQAVVVFPLAVHELLREQGFVGKKGSVIDTAIVAGVMGAKRTHELVPFCHPLALDDCQIRIEPRDDGHWMIECSVALTARTGAEMEALTGATVAALTLYDMVKALSAEIEIRSVRLIEKRGGKRDFLRQDTP